MTAGCGTSTGTAGRHRLPARTRTESRHRHTARQARPLAHVLALTLSHRLLRPQLRLRRSRGCDPSGIFAQAFLAPKSPTLMDSGLNAFRGSSRAVTLGRHYSHGCCNASGRGSGGQVATEAGAVRMVIRVRGGGDGRPAHERPASAIAPRRPRSPTGGGPRDQAVARRDESARARRRPRVQAPPTRRQ